MSDYPVIFLRPEPLSYYRTNNHTTVILFRSSSIHLFTVVFPLGRLDQRCANCDRAAENVQPWISNAKLNKFSATKYFLLCTSFHAFGIGLNPVVVDFQAKWISMDSVVGLTCGHYDIKDAECASSTQKVAQPWSRQIQLLDVGQRSLHIYVFSISDHTLDRAHTALIVKSLPKYILHVWDFETMQH
ncbi:hypothetical protein Tsp_00083 [Trichinella spiralis]|uniref:hypothetical protein n=1 Tax=Trichinella spiralis TaxID=6334 RepID=UPI0001EFBC64|nr:hypothetical protein Tsp_00083 [Trichinella spiralis]